MRRSTSRDRRSGVQSRLSGTHASACLTPPTSDTSYQTHRRVSPQGKLSAGAREARCGAPDRKHADKMPVHVNRRYKQRRRVLVVCRRTPLRGQVSPTLVQAGVSNFAPVPLPRCSATSAVAVVVFRSASALSVVVAPVLCLAFAPSCRVLIYKRPGQNDGGGGTRDNAR